MNNKISVIVPCYNQKEYIKETIDSVKNQTYSNWECIIIDDGSTDESVEVIESLISSDDRFVLLKLTNGGVSRARNEGINISTGGYVLPLDGDDKINSRYLELAINYFIENPDTDLVYCNAEFFGAKKGYWDLPEYTYEYMFDLNCIFCSAIYKKEDYLIKTQGYDTKLVYGYEDWDFWLQLLNKNSKVIKLKPVLFYYRQKETSRNTVVLEREKLDTTLKYIYTKFFEDFYENLGGNLTTTTVNKGGEFIHYLKSNKLRLNGNPLSVKSEELFFIQAERLKAIKKTLTYKLFVRFELSLKKKFIKYFN